MYTNRINRSTTAPTISSHPQLFIRRSEITFDERARYVEFVCDVWNEGRFGPGRVAPVVLDMSDRTEFEPVSFLDLEDSGQIGLNGSLRFCTLGPQGRAGHHAVEAAFRRARHMRSVTAAPHGNSFIANYSANQGRGSPCTHKHQRCVVI